MQVIEFGTDNCSYENLKQLFNAHKYVVLDFFAKWCGPCKLYPPKIEKWSKEFPNIQFVKINVEQYDSIFSAYGDSSIPLIVFIKSGLEIGKINGYLPDNVEKILKTMHD